MDAVIYTRVSHDNRSVSVQDQEKECRGVCEQKGWSVRAVFCDDGISASRYGKERPAWAALKAELRQGDILVVWEASRAGRDLEEFVALRNLCAQLDVPLSYSGRILDLSKGDDRFVGGLDALVAERESEQIKERVLRGKRTAATEGRPSTRPPWGYRLVRPGEWEFDPVEAPRVKAAVEKLLAGDSMYSVMRWIENTEGFTPSSLTNLKRALTNPALAGLRIHRKEVVGQGTWEPLITEEQHRRLTWTVNRATRTEGYTSRPGPEPKYLLTGIAKCGKCGDGLRWKPATGKRTPSYQCYRGHCSRVAHQLDAAVEKALFEFALVVSMAASAGGENCTAGHTDSADDDALRQIEELEQRLDEFTQAAVRGEVSAAAFAQIEKGLRAQIDALEPAPEPQNLDGILDAEALWPDATMRQRRDLLRKFLHITVVPAERRGARTGHLLIEPASRDDPFLASLSYWVGTHPVTAGWVARNPAGEEYDFANLDAETARVVVRQLSGMAV